MTMPQICQRLKASLSIACTTVNDAVSDAVSDAVNDAVNDAVSDAVSDAVRVDWSVVMIEKFH